MCLGGFKINPSSLHQALLSWAPGSGEWATTSCVATLKKIITYYYYYWTKNTSSVSQKSDDILEISLHTFKVWSPCRRRNKHFFGLVCPHTLFLLECASARTIAKRAKKKKRSVDFFAPKRCLLAFPSCLHLLFITSALGIPILNYKLHQ